MAATDRSALRVMGGATIIGVACFAVLRVFRHSRFIVPVLAVVGVVMIVAARGIWKTRRRSMEAEARQREAEFLRVMAPRRMYGQHDTPTDDRSNR